MMKVLSKKGSVLVYSLILISIAVMLAVVVLNTTNILSQNHEFMVNDHKISEGLSQDAERVFQFAKNNNANGSGFLDAINCPSPVSLSGSTLSGSVATVLKIEDKDSYYCLGNYQGSDIKIYFNTESTDLILAEYESSIVGLTNSGVGKAGDTTFTDSDNTFLDFSTQSYDVGDGIDDNINSDDYAIETSSGVLYGDNYVDDDADHRKYIIGNIGVDEESKNIFRSNTQMQKYIDENTNNADGVHVTIGASSGGYMFLDVSTDFSIEVYSFNKNAFDSYGGLETLEKKTGTNINSGSGYIRDTSGNLDLEGSIPADIMEFDFSTTDYAIFLTNSGTTLGEYTLSGYDSVSGSGLYIVPVNDSATGGIQYLGQTIIKGDLGEFMYGEKVLSTQK